MTRPLSPDRLDYLRRLVASAVSTAWHIHPSDCVTYDDLAALLATAAESGAPLAGPVPEMTWAECRARVVKVLQDNDWQQIAAHDEWSQAAGDVLEAVFEPLPWEHPDDVLARAGRPLRRPAAVVGGPEDHAGQLTVGETSDRCLWHLTEDHIWQSGCGESFVFCADGPKENSFRHCPYCGGALYYTSGVMHRA